MPSVLVTGANGFIAVTLLRTLLERGYEVVGTVRSESKIPYLRDRFNNDRLTFAVVPDIVAPGAFDKVLKEHPFDAVIHAGSPATFDIKDIVKDFYEPAIQGTTSILKSVAEHAPTVKRVVVTASIASVLDHRRNPRPGYVYTEADWNPITWDEGTLNVVDGYYASKTLAERAAWEYMKKESPKFSLTTICPPYVFGPPEQELSSLSQLNASSSVMYGYFSGKANKVENAEYIWVDVRDVALAHVNAIEKAAAANQRYIITQGRYSMQTFVDYIWEHYPERAAARGIVRGEPGTTLPIDAAYTADNSKSKKDLGIEYISIEQMLADTYKRFVELEEAGL